jgi:hypothetical protein
MKRDGMTMDKIKQIGLQVLTKELGPVGMIRFLQQFETGIGDYSEERHEWLDTYDMEHLIKDLEEQRKK